MIAYTNIKNISPNNSSVDANAVYVNYNYFASKTVYDSAAAVPILITGSTDAEVRENIRTAIEAEILINTGQTVNVIFI